MFGLMFSLITAYSFISKVPGMVKKAKEAKKTNALEKLLSNQGSCDNVSVANLENVYLSHDEFAKYFGNAGKAEGYVKSANNKSKHARFIDLESETCPILRYMWAESQLQANSPTGAQLHNFTLDEIKLGSKILSINHNDSLNPGLIDSKIDALLTDYINLGIVVKERIDNSQPESPTNQVIYLLNENAPNFKINKRYAVENNVLKYFYQGDNLGNLNSNYSKLADSKITIMPINNSLAATISNDPEHNKSVLEEVLINSDSVMLDDGQIVSSPANPGVLNSYSGKKVLLAPEQYNVYVRLNDAVLAQEEDKKKKMMMQGMQQATA